MAAKLRRVNATLGQMQKNLECSICLDLLQDPVSTKCDHQFCNFCILALLDSRRNSSAACPLCKEPVTKRSLTSNDRLNKIVRAVRGVVQAVEQDTGFRCTPPRGPRVLSQQSQTPSNTEPKETTSRKKTNKARKQGNLRQARSKTAESVPIYIDSDDIDISEASTQGIALITDFISDVVEDKLTPRSSRETRNRKPLEPVNQVQTWSPSVSSSSSKSQDEAEENHLKGNMQGGCNLLEALEEGSLGVIEQKDAKARRQVTKSLEELRLKVAEGLVDENTTDKTSVKLGNREESHPRHAAKILNQSRDKGDCLLQALDQGSFDMLGDFEVNDSNKADKSHLVDSHTMYSSHPDPPQDIPCTSLYDARNNLRANSNTTEVSGPEIQNPNLGACDENDKNGGKDGSSVGQGKLSGSRTSPSSAEEDPYEFIASQRTPRKPKPKRARRQKNPSGKSTKEFDYMKWKKSNSAEKRLVGSSQAAGSQASTQIQLVATTSSRSDESQQSQDEHFFRKPPEVKKRKVSPSLQKPHIRQLRSRVKNKSTGKEDIVESEKDVERERTLLEDNHKAQNQSDVTENEKEVIPSNEDVCLAAVDSDEDDNENYGFEDMSMDGCSDEGSSLEGQTDPTYEPSAETSICKSAPESVTEVNLPKRQLEHDEKNLVDVHVPHQECDGGSSLESLTDPSYEPSTETPTSLRTIPEIFTDGNPPRRQSCRTQLTLIGAPQPHTPHTDPPLEGHGEELMGCSQPQVKKHSPLASAGVFGQVYKKGRLKLKKSPGNDRRKLKDTSVMDVGEKVEKMYAEVEDVCSDDEDRPNIAEEGIVDDGDTEGNEELDLQNSLIAQAKGSGSSLKDICMNVASKADFVDQEDFAEVGDQTVALTEESDDRENNLEPQLNQKENSFAPSKEFKTPWVPQETGPHDDADVAKSDWEIALELAREFDTEPRQFSLRSSRRGKAEPESKDQLIHLSRTKPELEVSVKNKSGGRAGKHGEVVETSKAQGEAKGIETHTLEDNKQVIPTASKTDHTITAGKKALRQTSNSTTTKSKILKEPTSAAKVKRRSIRRSTIDDRAVEVDSQGGLIESYDSNSDHCALSTKQKAVTRTSIPNEQVLPSDAKGKDLHCGKEEKKKTHPKEGTEVDLETAETSLRSGGRKIRLSLRSRSCEKSVSHVSRENGQQEKTLALEGHTICDDVLEGSSSVHSSNDKLKEDEHCGGVRDSRRRSRNKNSSTGNKRKSVLGDEETDCKMNTSRDPCDDSFDTGKSEEHINQKTPNTIAALRILDDSISLPKEDDKSLKFQQKLDIERKNPESHSLPGSVSLFTADDEQQKGELSPMTASPQLTDPQQTGAEDGESGESDRTESIDLEGENVPAPVVTISETIPSGSDTESIELHENSDSSSIQFVSQGPREQPRKLLQNNQTNKVCMSLAERRQQRTEEISPMQTKQTPTSTQETPDQTPQERSKRRSSRKAKRLPEETESDTEEVAAQNPSNTIEKLKSIVSETTQVDVTSKSTATDETRHKSTNNKTGKFLTREKRECSSDEQMQSPETNVLSKRRQKPSPDSLILRSLEDSSNRESEKLLVSPPDHYLKTFARNPEVVNSEKPSPIALADSSGRRETMKRKSCPDAKSIAETKLSSKRQRSAGATCFSASKIQHDEAGTRRKSQRLSGVQRQDMESQQSTKSENAPNYLDHNVLEDNSGVIKDTECSSFGLQTRRKSRSLSRRGGHLRSQTSEIGNSSQKENTPASSRITRQKSQESHQASESYMTNSPPTNGFGTELGSQSLFDETPAKDSGDQDLAPSVSCQNRLQAAESSGQFETASEASSSLILNPIMSPKKNQQGCSANAASEENQARDSHRSSKAIKQKEQLPKRNSTKLTDTASSNSSEQLKSEPSISSKSTKSSSLSSRASLSIPFQGKVITKGRKSFQKPSLVVKKGMSEGGSWPTPSKATDDDFVSASEGASASPSDLSEPILIPRKHRFGKDLNSSYQKKSSAVTESIHVSGISQDVIPSSQPSPKPHPRKRKSSASTASRSKQTRSESREHLKERIVEVDDILDHPQETHQDCLNVREGSPEKRDESSISDLKSLKNDKQVNLVSREKGKKDDLLDFTKDEVTNRHCKGADVENNFNTSSDVEMASAEDERPHHDEESDEKEESCQESDDEEDDDDDVIIPPTPPCQVATNLQTNKRSNYSINSTSSLASSTSFKSSKSLAFANQPNSSRSNQSLKATNLREVKGTAANLPERNTGKSSVAVGADESSLDNSFNRRVFPLYRSPARSEVLQVTEQHEDTLDNSQSLSIFHQNTSKTSLKYPKTKQQEAIRRDDDGDNGVQEGEDEDPLGGGAEILEGQAVEEAGGEMEEMDAGKDRMNLMEGDDNEHEDVMTGIEDHRYDTEGSCCSESNCSHHLNLTSASSVLSSQSEFMSTQQRLKAQESLKTMALEIAQMEAALECDTEKHQGHEDDPEVEDHVEMEEDSEGDDHGFERQPSETEDPKKMLDMNDVDSNCSDDNTHNDLGTPADLCTPAELCTPADLCSQKNLYSSNNDSRETHSIKAIADSYIPTSQGDRGQSPQRSIRRSKPVISDDDESDSDEEIAGITRQETNAVVVNHSPCRSSRNQLEIPGVTTYGSNSDISEPEDPDIPSGSPQLRSQLEIPGVTTYGSDSDISEPEDPDIPSGSPRSPSPPPDLFPSTTRKASLANLPESVKEVSRLAAKFRSGGSRAVDDSHGRRKGRSKNRSKALEGRSWMNIEDPSDDEDYSSSPRRSKNAAPQKSRSVPERQTSGWKSKTLEMKSAQDRILPRSSESVKDNTPLRKSRQPGQALLNSRRNLYHSNRRGENLNKSGRGDRDQDGPSGRDQSDSRVNHHRDETPDERSLSPVIGRSRHTTPGTKKTKPISFVSTGLNRENMKDVEQLAKIFGCRFASTFNACTTHVIVNTDEKMVCERTLKYFQGIAARKWVVSLKWVSACLKTEELLSEEPFEVRGDVVNGSTHKGPRRARLSKPPYPLHKYDVCCVGPFTGLNKEQLVSLVELMGASTVQQPSLFPYNEGRKPIIVAQADVRDLSYDYDVLYRKFRVPIISREWILDIIATYKVQPMADYLLSSIESAQPVIDVDSEID